MPNSIAWQVKWQTTEQRKEYTDWRRESAQIVKRLFSPIELVIFYQHFGLGWGRQRILKSTGINHHIVTKVICKFKAYAGYASNSYEHEIKKALAYNDNLNTD